MSARTGVAAYVQYAKEATFGDGDAGTTTANVALGLDEKVTNLSYKNNQQKVSALNDNAAVAFAYGKREVEVGIDFVLSNPWFFEALLGKKTTGAAQSGIYPHTFAKDKAAHGFAMELGIDFPTNVVLKCGGTILQNASLSASVGEMINVSTSWMAGQAAVGTSMTTDADDTENFPYTFAHMAIKIPSATAISGITSFSLDINPNVNLLYNIGSRDSVNAARGLLDISGRLERPMVDGSMLQKVTQFSEVANCEIKLDNGGSTTKKKDMVMTGTGMSFSNYSTSLTVDDVITESLDFEIRDLSIVAKTSTATSPV